MLSCFTRRPIYFNKNLSNYCRNFTNESIRKLTENYNLERNNPKISNIFDNDNDDNGNNKPKFDIYNFLIFFSISIMSIYIYKRLK